MKAKAPDSSSHGSGRVWLAVGLGNPGFRYRRTRHNAGFMAVDRLASRLGVRFARSGETYVSAETAVQGQTLVLVKPLTYMNRSGKAVAEAAKRYGVQPQHILVMCDDMNLPSGTIRIRGKGSDGGQRGVASIIEALNTGHFPRIRIGIGSSGGRDAADYVLSRFRWRERPVVRKSTGRAAEAVLSYISRGPDKTMTEYNRNP